MANKPYKYRTHVIDWSKTEGFNPLWSTYNSWKNMRMRCASDHPSMYPYYKAKGIKVCEEWADSFEKFVDDMGMCPYIGWSIDRIDGSGDYNIENCEWASPLMQALNRNYGEDQGVYLQPNGKWIARVRVHGKDIHLGTFEEKEMAKAYRDSGTKLLKRLARLGFLG